MVRLERVGDSFVFITGATQKPDIGVLLNALSELTKELPDIEKLKEGILYLDNTTSSDIRKELRLVLQKAMENKSHKDLCSRDNIL